MYPYSGRLPSPPPVMRVRPNAVRAVDVPRGFPLVGNGLGGFPVRKTEVPDAWELGVEITAGGQDYTVDIEAGTGINLYIDWGDGLIELFQSTGDKTHTYSAPGGYTVRITGGFAASGNIRLGSNSGNRARLKKTSIVPFIPGLLNFYATFQGCTGLTSIPTDLFRYNYLVSGFYQTFYGCTGLTGAIPADLFRYNTLVSMGAFQGTFQGCTGLTGSIPADLFRHNILATLSAFARTFQGCTGLTGAIPTDLFRYNTLVSSSGFYSTFNGCTGLTSLPTDLFRYNTAVSTDGFRETFISCTGLTSLPTDLFRYNTAVSTSGFYMTFYGCTGLTSLPTDLFRYNTAVSTSGFNGTFRDCTGLTSLPTDLFRYNTAVSTYGFAQTFLGCGLTSLPTDLFRYNTAVSTGGFAQTFLGCDLTTAPALLLKYNVNCTSFTGVFQYCSKLQLRADLFFDTGEEGTRFLNQTVNFTDALRIGTFTGTQGTAPALWSCDFGTGAATTTNCFTGHTTSSVDNYASIPTAWGGA